MYDPIPAHSVTMCATEVTTSSVTSAAFTMKLGIPAINVNTRQQENSTSTIISREYTNNRAAAVHALQDSNKYLCPLELVYM